MSRLGVNLAGIQPSTPASPFLQWERNCYVDFYPRLTVSGVAKAGNDLAPYIDSNLNLIDPLPAGASQYNYLVLLNPVGLTYGKSYAGTAMKATWEDGGGVTSLAASGDATAGTANLGARTHTFTLNATTAAPQGGFCTGNVQLNFNLTSGGQPPRNIKIFKAVHESRVLAGEIFDPDWYTETSQWAWYRFMDWTETNFSPATNYVDLTATATQFWRGANITGILQRGTPISAIVALANLTLKPIWICIPHLFTDAAVTSLANYLKTNLNPAVHVYFEYSNENWNYLGTAGASGKYCVDQGALIGAWSAQQAFQKAWSYSGYRAAQCMELIRTEFGTDSGTGRWSGVMGIQVGAVENIIYNYIGLDYHISADAGATQSRTKLFSLVGVAPYPGATISTTASGAGATLLTWANESLARDDNYEHFNKQFYNVHKLGAGVVWPGVDYYRALWQSAMTSAAAKGMGVAMYEGKYGGYCLPDLRDNTGTETEGTKMNLALSQFADSAYCGLIESQMYTAYLADGGVLPNLFADIYLRSKYGPWGSKQYLGDTNAAARMAESFSSGKSNFVLGTVV